MTIQTIGPRNFTGLPAPVRFRSFSEVLPAHADGYVGKVPSFDVDSIYLDPQALRCHAAARAAVTAASFLSGILAGVGGMFLTGSTSSS